MKDFSWYRKLRGGMWAIVSQEWTKVHKSKYSNALNLKQAGFTVEDNRYSFEK